MADNQVEIEIIAKAELSDAESLEDLIDRIRTEAGEEITLQMVADQVQAELESTIEEVGTLQEQLLNMELGDPDFANVQSQLEEATAKVEELSSSLETINDLVIAPQVDTTGLDEMNEKVAETSSSADNLTTAIAGIGATAGIDQMITKADNVNTSWNQLTLTFRNTGVSMDDLKAKSSALSETTGRSGSQVRDYFNQMGIAGITNIDLLSNSFENMAGRAYQTGTSIESIEGAVQRMVLTGNAGANVLRRIGLTSEDLGNAMGVSADEAKKAFQALSETERLEVLNKVMGDGTEANEMYKDSYAGLKEQADIALGGLMVAIGQSILPVVVPALKTATEFVEAFRDGFKALPEPVQTAIGGLGGVIAISTAAIGILGTFGSILKNVYEGFKTLKDVGSFLNITDKLSSLKTWLLDVAGAAKQAALELLNAGKNALIAGYNALKSAAMWAYEKLAKIASTVASYAMAAAQWVLNAAMSANPITLIVIALAALVGALVWAYYNVDWFREMVDNAWASLVEFAGQLMGAVTSALEWVGSLFQNFTNQLGLNTNDWTQAVLGFILFIPQLPFRIGVELANALAKALGFKTNFVSYITNAARDGVNGFVSWIVGVYNKFREEVDKILEEGDRLARELPPKIAKAGLGVLGNWIDTTGEESPGYMYDAFHGELTAMQDTAKKHSQTLPATIGNMGSGMLNDFDVGNGFATGNTGVAGNITINLEIGSVDNDERVNEIVDAVRRALSWDNRTAGRTV